MVGCSARGSVRTVVHPCINGLYVLVLMCILGQHILYLYSFMFLSECSVVIGREWFPIGFPLHDADVLISSRRLTIN